MSDKMQHAGRCFCGAVQFTATGEPAAMGYCHCESCRHWSAGPVNAFTGPADQCRHDSQWQYPIAAGSPVAVNCTAPQKQLPACCFLSLIFRPPPVDLHEQWY
ncbi:MAG TPA: hypothetical protein VG840_10295, partial [Casimicrobiaceae bacterium]|nr:hypothetical protein [Casimicrobiaceae bacterium]